MFGSLWSEIRQAARGLARSPGFALMSVLSLALGIGANVAIFLVVDAVLLRPLPYPEPDRLVSVARSYPGGLHGPASVRKFLLWRERATLLEDVSAYDFSGGGLNLSGGDAPEQVRGIRVSRDFFRAFGVRFALGRAFLPEDDRPGGPRVVVLSDGLWKRRFGSDPAVVGRRLSLGADAYTVVGVTRAFQADPPADVWLPLQADPATTNTGHFLRVVARLEPGVTLQAANEQLRTIGEEFRRIEPHAMGATETVRAHQLRDEVVGDARQPLAVLSAAVGFVLLIACANAANLVLARGAGRRRELAVRAALGASRGRVARHLLVESLLLSLVGGAAGSMVGAWGVRSLLALSPASLPRVAQLTGQPALLGLLGWKVLAFATLVGAAAVALTGLLPALGVSGRTLAASLVGGRDSTPGPLQQRARSALIVVEVALALVLVASATMLGRALLAIDAVESGVATGRILTLQVSLAGEKYSTASATGQYEREVTRRLEALPGVTAAAHMLVLPLTNDMDMPFVLDDRPLAAGERFSGDEFWRYVGPHYFRVFDIPARRGRLFDDHDDPAGRPVAVVNEAFAAKYWPGGEAIGRRVIVGKGMGPLEDVPREIVGIARNTREAGVQRPVRPVLYVPEAQLPDGYMRFGHSVVPLTWAVRTTIEPHRLADAVRRELLAADAGVPPAEIRTMAEIFETSTARERLNTTVMSVFGAVALLLAALGVYGSIAYTVSRRTREIGIRISLGAAPNAIVRSIGGRALWLAALGVLLGTTAALALTRLVAKLLLGAAPPDAPSVAFAAVLLLAVGGVAGYLPARRASHVDPTIALREER